MAVPNPGLNMVNFNNLEVFYRYVDPKQKDLGWCAHHRRCAHGGIVQPALPEDSERLGAVVPGGGRATVGGAANANYDFASIQAGAGFHTPLIHNKSHLCGRSGISTTPACVRRILR
jgi:hypothetical protein